MVTGCSAEVCTVPPRQRGDDPNRCWGLASAPHSLPPPDTAVGRHFLAGTNLLEGRSGRPKQLAGLTVIRKRGWR